MKNNILLSFIGIFFLLLPAISQAQALRTMAASVQLFIVPAPLDAIFFSSSNQLADI